MLVILLGVIGASVLFFSISSNRSTTTPTVVQESTYKTEASNKAAVTVQVTPETLNPGSPAVFKVEMNTHSVDLNYDIVNLAQIADDSGITYKPTSWTGGKGGHHIEGILTFPSLARSKKITLIIRGIDNESRIFSWNLNI